MNRYEIINALHEAVGYIGNEMYFTGSIASTFNGTGDNDLEYGLSHYPKMVKLLESLPWTVYKKNKPSLSGRYLTMLDCNEHMVTISYYNREEGKWSSFPDHVKWWMVIP